MLRRLAVIILLTAACSNEQPVPDAPASDSAPPPAVPSTATLTPASATPAQPQSSGTYQQAMDWLRSSNGFHFELTESGVRAEGDMVRPTVGAERVRFTADGTQWLAVARPSGIVWHRKNGAAWEKAVAPIYGDRVYQRVTLAFDPQKKEGEAQLAGGDAATNLYRFTNANTGDVHELWVARRDGQIERMKIGEAVEIRFGTPPGDVPNP